MHAVYSTVLAWKIITLLARKARIDIENMTDVGAVNRIEGKTCCRARSSTEICGEEIVIRDAEVRRAEVVVCVGTERRNCSFVGA